MRIPIALIVLLPKRWHNWCIQQHWNDKTDKDVLDSFEDATGWIDLSMGYGWDESPTMNKIAEDCINRLEVYVLPQMRARGLI